MKTRTRELAKVGIFGSKDNPQIVTEKDLQEIAETFPDVQRAPIKLGNHWSDDKPRLAQVTSVSYNPETKTLSGTIEENDVLSKAVDDGYYPDVSIGAKQRATDGKLYLNHVAYLGDEAPAVKDLESSIQKELDNSQQVKIAASDAKDVRIFPGTAEHELYLSDSKPKKNEINGHGSEAREPLVPGGPFFTKNPPQEVPSMTEEEIKKLQDENAKLKAEADAKEKLLSDSYAKQKEADLNALRKACEGKLPEPETTRLIALADSFEAGKTIELSDAAGAKTTVSAVAVLTDIMGKVKLPVEPGALNLSDTGTPAVQVKPTDAARMAANM
jgi:hypothetical protein